MLGSSDVSASRQQQPQDCTQRPRCTPPPPPQSLRHIHDQDPSARAPGRLRTHRRRGAVRHRLRPHGSVWTGSRLAAATGSQQREAVTTALQGWGWGRTCWSMRRTACSTSAWPLRKTRMSPAGLCVWMSTATSAAVFTYVLSCSTCTPAAAVALAVQQSVAPPCAASGHWRGRLTQCGGAGHFRRSLLASTGTGMSHGSRTVLAID